MDTTPAYRVVNHDGSVIDYAMTAKEAGRIGRQVANGEYDDNPREAYVEMLSLYVKGEWVILGCFDAVCHTIFERCIKL